MSLERIPLHLLTISTTVGRRSKLGACRLFRSASTHMYDWNFRADFSRFPDECDLLITTLSHDSITNDYIDKACQAKAPNICKGRAWSTYHQGIRFRGLSN